MIGSCMKRRVITVSPVTTAQEAARIVVSHHVGTLPVVDARGVLVGVVRLDDLLQVFMPDFVALMDNIDFVHDFGALEILQPQDMPEAARLTMRLASFTPSPPRPWKRTCRIITAAFPCALQALLRLSQPHASRAGRSWLSPSAGHLPRLQEGHAHFRATAKHRFSIGSHGSEGREYRPRFSSQCCEVQDAFAVVLPEPPATAHNLDERRLLCTYVI